MHSMLTIPKRWWAFLLSAMMMHAALGQVDISGKITDAQEGTPLPGARVVVVGASIGAYTDEAGSFSLTVPSDDAVLAISYLGYASLEEPVGGRSVINVSLEASYNSLEEVVVTGYGSKKKLDVIGAISSVSSDDFEAQPITRVSDALQGRAAGVQVNSTDGSPGNNARIRIRGTNSITGSGAPLIVVDGVIGAGLGSINPSDIESMQVLKDASATAQYGSRGANGVILITTRRGASVQPTVSFDAFWGLQSLPRKIDVVDGGTYARLINEQLAVGGGAPIFGDDALAVLDSSGGTDWQDEIYRGGTEALQQNYSVSFSGRKEGLSYYISGNYVDHEGILVNNFYNRLALRSNLSLDVSDKLNVGLNVNLSQEQAFNGFISNLLFAPNASALVFDPTSPVYDADSNLISTSNFGSIGVSPVAAALGRQDDRLTNTQTATFFLNYEILKGLSYSLTAGLRNVNYTGTMRVEGVATNGVDEANVFNNDFQSFQHTHLLQYQTTFADVHNLTVKGIVEEQAFSNYGSSALGQGLLVPGVGIDNIGFANSQVIASGQSEEAIRSVMARVEYDFDNRFLLTGTVRRDGSSKFAEQNRFSVFPSAAIAWRISEEGFMQNLNRISELKIRASYGQIGNQAIAPYSTFGLLNTGLAFNSVLDNTAAVIGIAPGRFPNPNLRWETTTQLDVGLDLGFFDGRITGSFDYYQKNTNDLLLFVSVPSYTGVSSELRNVGSLKNEGFEIDLSAVVINTPSLWWEASFNLARNQTTVLDLGDVDNLFVGGGFAGSASILSRVEVGGELGNFLGYINEGVWTSAEADQAAEFGLSPGDTKYRDLNGDKQINGDDITIIGNGAPDFAWGLNNTLTYKGFELNVFVQSLVGHDVFNIQRAIMLGASGDVRTPTHGDIENRWTPDNENTDIPAFSSTNFQVPEDSRFVEDGTFVRLRNVRLSYQFSPRYIKGFPIKGITLYASGQNLYTFTGYKGYDPEVSGAGDSNVNLSVDNGTYPNPRVITLGANFTF